MLLQSLQITEQWRCLRFNSRKNAPCFNAGARLRAERRWGELYREADKAKGVKLNGSVDGTGKTSVVVSDDRREQPKTLSDMGVSKDQSSG